MMMMGSDVILLLASVAVSLPLLAGATVTKSAAVRELCLADLVATIPANLNYNKPSGQSIDSISTSLIDLIKLAQRNIKIASSYISLMAPDSQRRFYDTKIDPALPGNMIIDALEAAGQRGVKLEIVLGERQSGVQDLRRLRPYAKIHYLDYIDGLDYFFVMNSKFIIVDDEHLHLGPTDLVWSSLSLNKALGITLRKCKSMARDLGKIFQTYVLLADPTTNAIKSGGMPERFHTILNVANPMNITVPNKQHVEKKQSTYRMFFGGSPDFANDQTDRTSNLDALMHVINNAKEFIYVSMPEYTEAYHYVEPKEYWSTISDALKRAAFERGVKVRLLFDKVQSLWGSHSVWYKSLVALENVGGGISVHLFEMPTIGSITPSKMDKYVVTDRGLYLGTSSMTPDFLNKFTGVGLVIEPKSQKQKELLQTVEEMFVRDYYSRYSYSI